MFLGEIHENYSIEYIIGGEKGLTIEGTKESNYLDFSQVTPENVSAIDAGYGDDGIRFRLRLDVEYRAGFDRHAR